MKGQRSFFGLALVLLLPAVAEAADRDEGEKLARRVCSTCHAITAGLSPMAEAPPFASIARSKKFRIKGAGLLFDEHVIMPTFAFTNEQAEDIAAYLKSLARPRDRY
jgi:mono/diheme cytochrome c family protein